ncbi:MAG: thiamine phosphate synthase [Chitinispirillaceae bacterium]|nr:thiamine phosphate synthase [Chitinispirillaceae bacterium]
MKIKEIFGFYSILTNPLKGYEYCTKLLVDEEIYIVQLRIKEHPEIEILKIAEKMRKITEGTKTLLIINDYPEIAKKVGADGVHIGQQDIPFLEAKKIVGENTIIGISTHSPEQTQKTCKLHPDYIGIGPVFKTPTKKNPDPVIGIDGMKEMLKISTVPAVVIGGIDLTNLSQVLEAGAKNFCMVRQFTEAENPEEVIKKIKSIYRNFYPHVM